MPPLIRVFTNRPSPCLRRLALLWLLALAVTGVSRGQSDEGGSISVGGTIAAGTTSTGGGGNLLTGGLDTAGTSGGSSGSFLLSPGSGGLILATTGEPSTSVYGTLVGGGTDSVLLFDPVGPIGTLSSGISPVTFTNVGTSLAVWNTGGLVFGTTGNATTLGSLFTAGTSGSLALVNEGAVLAPTQIRPVLPNPTGPTFASDQGVTAPVPPETDLAGQFIYAPVTLPPLPIGTGGTGIAPSLSTQPASLTANAGSSASFTAAATGTPAPQFQWIKDGAPLPGATSSSYTISSAGGADAGAYQVLVSNSAGAVLSSTALLSVQVDPSEVFTTMPASVVANAGAPATFTVGSADSALSYFWSFDGSRIPSGWAMNTALDFTLGALTYTFPISGNSSGDGTSTIAGGSDASLTVSGTGNSLALAVVGPSDAGNYRVHVYKAGQLEAVFLASLAVNSDARLTNLSSRGQVGTGDNALIVGFVNAGPADKQVLLRGVGPTLGASAADGGFAVSGALPDPEITLKDGRADTIDSNGGWADSAAIAAAGAQVGAFPLVAGSADAALLESLSAGSYTAQITGLDGTTGIALAELYDADSGTPADALVNISTRAQIAGGANVLIAGFAVTGTTSEEVLIRGVGPTLGSAPFNLVGALSATKVTLFDASGNQITSNEGWSGDVRIAAAAAYTGAFPYAAGSLDSALLVTLPAGSYTAEVEGPAGATGVGMVEIYEVK